MIRMKDENQTEFAMGEWASARKGGIRNFRYSTSTVSISDLCRLVFVVVVVENLTD